MYHNCYYTVFASPFDSPVTFDCIEDARKCAKNALFNNKYCIAVDIVDVEADEVVEFVTRGS